MIVLALAIFFGLGLFVGKVADFYTRVSANWDNISWTVDHPKLVDNLRNDYASKSAELEQAYINHQPTAEQQLLQQVADQLKQGK